MNKPKGLQRTYVSELSEFLEEFEKLPGATSVSRRAEEEKYRRIHKLRDEVKTPPKTDQLWTGF